jgi:hypothetical protein
MRLDVTIDGDLSQMMKGQLRAGERAVSSAMRGAGQTLKTQWREQVVAAGLGRRLANTVRLETYPKGQPSLKAAALVYSRAPKILDPNETGAVIRSRDGFWLSIPLPAAGVGPKGKKLVPGEWERKTGRRLRFVYLDGRRALLVDDGTKAPGNVLVKRRGRLSDPVTFRNRTIPIFLLVPQVRLRKRLHLFQAADAVGSTIPGMIVSNWKGE